MISNQDRVYYIDPVQVPIRRPWTDRLTINRVVELRSMRESGVTSTNIGQIVNVTAQQYDMRDIWWVNTDGNYIYGAPIYDATGPLSGATVISLLDEGFILGLNEGNASGGGGSLLHQPVRSDGRLFPTNAQTVAKNMVRAASWARGLMPEPGDTQAVVNAKVAIAKQKFMQRAKKAQVYREGIARDWLDLMSELRDEHDLPEPQFSLGVNGTALINTGRELLLSDLPEQARERISGLQSNQLRASTYGGVPTSATQYVSVPYRALTHITVNDLAQLRTVEPASVRSAVKLALSNTAAEVIEHDRFPVLVGF